MTKKKGFITFALDIGYEMIKFVTFDKVMQPYSIDLISSGYWAPVKCNGAGFKLGKILVLIKLHKLLRAFSSLPEGYGAITQYF
jgi:hypothetical protein